MSADFSLELRTVSRGLPKTFQQDAPLNQRLQRSNFNYHFVYITIVNRDIEGFESKELPKLKAYKVAEKVTQAVLFLIPILMSIGFMYAPVWLPIVVGLPTFIALALIKAKVFLPRIDIREHQYQSLILLREMLRDHSFKSLLPMGEWDLPEIDPRLKSDMMMKEELKKKHPQSAQKIARMVSTLDLEVSPYPKVHASKTLAQYSNLESHWGALQKEVGKSHRLLHTKNFEAFEGLSDQIVGAALQSNDAIPFTATDIPLASCEDRVRHVVNNYAALCRLLRETQQTYEEALRQYDGLAAAERLTENWESAIVSNMASLKETVKVLLKVVQKDPKNVAAADWLLANLYVQDKEISRNIAFMAEEARRMQKLCREKIEGHAQKRVQKYGENLSKLSKSILSVKTLNAMSLSLRTEQFSSQAKERYEAWKTSERGIISNETLSRLDATSFPEIAAWKNIASDAVVHDSLSIIDADNELKDWLSSRPHLKGESRQEIYHRNFLMQEAFLKAKREFREICGENNQNLQTALGNNDHYQAFIDRLETFNKGSFLDLKKMIGWGGIVSHGERFRKALFRRLVPSTQPFEKIQIKEADSDFLSCRKVEEMHVNEMLKQIDKKMIYTNRGQQFGIHVAVSVFLLAEAIILFFISNPWISWGISVGVTGLQISSLVFTYFLKKMAGQKVGLKFHSILRDRPLISQVPGNRPVLDSLRTVQQKYHLDGVRATWGRILGEGDSALSENAIKRGNQKETRRSIASEGRKQASSYLGERYVYLSSSYFSMSDREKRASTKRVRLIKASLKEKDDQIKQLESSSLENPHLRQENRRAILEIEKQKGMLLMELETLPSFQIEQMEMSLQGNISSKAVRKPKSDYELKIRELNRINKIRDGLWDEIYEAEGNLKYYSQYFPFLALRPAELAPFLETASSLEERALMLKTVTKALARALEEERRDPQAVISEVAKKISRGENITSEEIRVLKLLSADDLKKAVKAIALAEELFMKTALLAAINNAETGEGERNYKKSKELVLKIENHLLHTGKIPDSLLEQLKKVPLQTLNELSQALSPQVEKLGQDFDTIKGSFVSLFTDDVALDQKILRLSKMKAVLGRVHQTDPREDLLTILTFLQKVSQKEELVEEDFNALKSLPRPTLLHALKIFSQMQGRLIKNIFLEAIEKALLVEDERETEEINYEPLMKSIERSLDETGKISNEEEAALTKIPVQSLQLMKQIVALEADELKQRLDHLENQIFMKSIQQLKGWDLRLFNAGVSQDKILGKEREKAISKILKEMQELQMKIVALKNRDAECKRYMDLISVPSEQELPTLEKTSREKLEELCRSWNPMEEDFSEWWSGNKARGRQFISQVNFYELKTLYWVLPEELRKLTENANIYKVLQCGLTWSPEENENFKLAINNLSLREKNGLKKNYWILPKLMRQKINAILQDLS